MYIDAFGALILLVILAARQRLRADSLLLQRLLPAMQWTALAVLILSIPALLLDGRIFFCARALLWIIDTGCWLLHSLYCFLWVCFADWWCFRSEARLRRRARYYAVFLFSSIALLLTNPWTNWMFTLNGANAYAPGRAYLLCQLPNFLCGAAALVLGGFGCLTAADALQRRRCLSLLAYMLLPAAGAVMERLVAGISWFYPMVALSLLIVNQHLQQEDAMNQRLTAAQSAETAAHNARTAVQMNAEMANSRMMIMLSQIQPHFLYNALCVIQDLCHGKAPEAEQATIAFSRFLRGNLDSLNASKPVPFSQEFSHTRHYLTLEQLRFGDRLHIEYDIQAKMFSMPAMTLQPIVENAVRYGVMQRESGGTVRISSVESDREYTIIIEDDGVGFDPYQKHDDGRTHIGIANVRQRLREMCGGELEIVSMRGTGTVAAIILPKERAEE